MEKPGGGICELQEVAPESMEESTSTETKKLDVEIKSQKKSSTPEKVEKKTAQKKTLADNGQTFLDVSKGDIRITKNGATGGGLVGDEASLNPKGYWITGTTTQYNLIVEENVKTDITLENVKITRELSHDEKTDCINVSHANITITLIGNNELLCNSGGNDPDTQGAALAKDGMDGSLTIQCEYAGKKGHRCDDQCGSLIAKGKDGLFHAGAISSTTKNAKKKKESGFANLEIKGGNIEASGGTHCPGIGSACVSEDMSGGYTKNIRISGGNVKAIGTENGSGIGSGFENKVEGIYITGGVVEAKGGAYAPGIGASKCTGEYPGETMVTKDVCISGGDTIVIAIGDQSTNMPGIGSGAGSDKVFNVKISPDFGYQGYIQDGTSLTDYTFANGTPFKEVHDISVENFIRKYILDRSEMQLELKRNPRNRLGLIT